ncbi:MAG: DUF177 domain-containing protein [Candidatus Hydrogenedentes bacterium]|nr:DUF177 domain-containing protein [Candidatus Hydrogenedentota bacterium]
MSLELRLERLGGNVVNKLVVPLSHMTDKGLTIRAEVTTSELIGPDSAGEPAGTVTVSGTLTELGDEYLFRGELSGSFVSPCDRCLQPAAFPFRIEVCWTYAEGPEPEPGDEWNAEDSADSDAFGDEPSFHRYCGAEIDLRPEVREEVALALPAKFLCATDCAGLCPKCGANLNLAPCQCSNEVTLENKGLAGLGDLFPELRPKDLEG